MRRNLCTDYPDMDVRCEYSSKFPCYAGQTPGMIQRYSLEHGVPVSITQSEQIFDDADNFSEVDPLSDIRTDWDDLNARNFAKRQSSPADPVPADPVPADPAPAPALSPAPAPAD